MSPRNGVATNPPPQQPLEPHTGALETALGLHQQGSLPDAEHLYRAILQRHPNHPDALYLLGILTLQTNRASQAVELFDQHIALNPNSPEAFNNRGLALLASNRPNEALASYDRAITLNPGYPEAHSNRGNALQALNRPHEALASYDHAVALKPDYPEAYYNRGSALETLHRPEAALATYNQAIALKPDFVAAYYNRANLLRALNRPADAVASCDQAIALQPDFAEAHYNRGNALRDLNRPAEAVASYDNAIVLRPDYAEAHNNRGDALQELDRLDEALASYDRAITARPHDAQVHLNNAMCLLKQGVLPRGWSEYEWRWQTAQLVADTRAFDQPLWRGDEPLAGRTILLHAEQGFGDTLQFCRYAPLVAAQGANVVLEIPDALVRLATTLGAGTVVTRGDPLPPFDLHCPLMSLPLAFQTTLETIPAPVPYLKPDPQQVMIWGRRLAALPGARVGLVWAGQARHHSPEIMAVDRRRSITLAHLAPLAALPDVSFVSLQTGEPATQTSSSALPVHDFTDHLTDFADTAALIAALDLVITVDTAVAHLAGALAKPVWILNRHDSCWRWLLNRPDTPWYPTARLFRQPSPGDWHTVITKVAAHLSRVRERSARSAW